MISHCSRYIIMFNGEIYNFREIRTKLIQKGIKFRGSSDTEVLLNAISIYGRKRYKTFEVNAAIALWDKDYGVLHLVRDRIGEKPLYYGWQKDIFLFSSELKAIKKHPNFVGTISKKSVSLQLRYGSIPGPYSIYENILKLNQEL